MSLDHLRIKKIINLLTRLEAEYNLFEWRINSVYVYQASRIYIYTSLLDISLSKNFLSARFSVKQKLYNFCRRFFVNSILLNPFIDFKKAEVLIFESGRMYLVGNEYFDIYTKYLCDDLAHNKIPFTSYSTNYRNDHLSKRIYHSRHIDFIHILSKLFSKFIHIQIPPEDLAKIKAIESEINRELDLEINLTQIFSSQLQRFKSEYPIYKAFLKLKRPKSVFITNSGEKSPLICAAKDEGILVNELQHGLIVKEDMVAHFPNVSEGSLKYFPDRFYVWKDLPMWTSKLPISSENIIMFPNQYLRHMMQLNQDITRDSKQILIVSQPYCSTEIFDFITSNVIDLPEWKFVYKVHPSEEPSAYIVDLHNRNLEHSNLTFVYNERSIYQLFSESNYVIGVFSTAVFEATYFGCKVLLLDLPGVEMSESLIENGIATLVKNHDKLSDILL